jgi:hypothetical protein
MEELRDAGAGDTVADLTDSELIQRLIRKNPSTT